MKNIIPEHEEGKKVDAFETVEFENTQAATDFYPIAEDRLKDINNWNHIATLPSATFQLVDTELGKVERYAQQGDLVRIDIPGPGLPSSDGFDWVRVESIAEEQEEDGSLRRTVITLRPTSDPTNENSDTAHFFKDMATSTILLEQKHNAVSAHYAGRNELVNTENESITDNIRNFLVGAGVKMGASLPQWKALVAGIIRTEDVE